MKVIALCCYHDAAQYLREFVDHLQGHVQHIILLDDRSADSSRRGRCAFPPKDVTMLQPCCRATRQPHAFESQDRLALLREAIKHEADYVLCLDVDMRCERRLLSELPFLADQEPQSIFSLRLRDLWNDFEHYRTDGVWSRKRLSLLFPCPRQDDLDHYYAPGTLHAPWVPTGMDMRLATVELDYSIYHLGMVTPEMRAARVAKFNAIDGEHKFQTDYNYLADESGLALEAIPPNRGWK